MELNMIKYYNYKEQSIRLKKAINHEFYLEALFIEYAIFEDRVQSILSYNHNEIISDRFVSIDRKLRKIKKLAEENNAIIHRYFNDGVIDEILAWKEERNTLIHALMKQTLTKQELVNHALKGNELVKKICNKSTKYKKAIERLKEKVN